VDAATGLKWHPDLQSAVQEAITTDKPVLIDFTGYTCTNCRLNERAVFPRSEIQQRLAHFSLAQLYTDGGADGPSNQKYELDHFGDVALPLYGIVDPKSGRVISSIAGVVSPAKFADFLDRGLAAQQPASQVAATAAPAWSPLSDSAIASAKQQSKPVIIDFTADWCVNCKIIEKEVFASPEVVPQLSDFVTLKSDMTNWSSPANSALQQKYNIQSLPAIVFLDKNGAEIKSLRITGRLPVADFLKRLKTAG
jgi:thiol:disulfide interchange protein